MAAKTEAKTFIDSLHDATEMYDESAGTLLKAYVKMLEEGDEHEYERVLSIANRWNDAMQAVNEAINEL